MAAENLIGKQEAGASKGVPASIPTGGTLQDSVKVVRRNIKAEN